MLLHVKVNILHSCVMSMMLAHHCHVTNEVLGLHLSRPNLYAKFIEQPLWRSWFVLLVLTVIAVLAVIQAALWCNKDINTAQCVSLLGSIGKTASPDHGAGRSHPARQKPRPRYEIHSGSFGQLELTRQWSAAPAKKIGRWKKQRNSVRNGNSQTELNGQTLDYLIDHDWLFIVTKINALSFVHAHIVNTPFNATRDGSGTDKQESYKVVLDGGF